MLNKYRRVTHTFLFLLYIITPLYIIFYSESLADYAMALLILSLGFILHFIFENVNNKKVREFLLKWF
jgi:membrane-bound metal-dependent hydrolase YbcI (DUF457 family)